MAENEIKFQFTAEPSKLNSALDDSKKRSEGAEGGIQKFLSTTSKETGILSGAVGTLGKAFSGVLALVGASKVLDFFGDAIDHAQKLESELEGVAKASAGLGTTMEDVEERLDNALEGLGDSAKNSVGQALLNVKKLAYSFLADIATAVNNAFTPKDPEKIVEGYQKQRDALTEIGTQLDTLNKIQKRTAEEELQFIMLKQQLSGELDKLGLSYNKLAGNAKNYLEVAKAAAQQSRRMRQAELYQLAQGLDQGVGNERMEQYERLQRLERLKVSGGMRSQEAQILIRESAEFKRNEEIRKKRAAELRKMADNIDKELKKEDAKPEVIAGQAQIENEQRFLQAAERLREIENARIYTSNKARRDYRLGRIDENERDRRIQNANADAKILAGAEIGTLRAAYSQFNEDKLELDLETIRQTTAFARKASEELFEAEKKQQEQLHERRIANGEDETESQEILEQQLQASKIRNEKRLSVIRNENINKIEAANLAAMQRTLNGASQFANGLKGFGNAKDAASGLQSGGQMMQGLSQIAPAMSSLGPVGAVMGVVGGLLGGLSSMFDKSEDEIRKEAIERQRQQQEVIALLTEQTVYMKEQLALAKEARLNEFTVLQRQNRLVDIQAAQDILAAGGNADTIKSIQDTANQKKLANVNAAIQNQVAGIQANPAGYSITGTAAGLTDYLNTAAGPQSSATDAFLALIGRIGQTSSRESARNIYNELMSYQGRINPSVWASAYPSIAAYGSFLAKNEADKAQMASKGIDVSRPDTDVMAVTYNSNKPVTGSGSVGWRMNSNMQWYKIFTEDEVNSIYNLKSALGGLQGIQNTNQTNIEAATNLLGLIEESNSLQEQIAAATKKTAANTDPSLQGAREQMFLDIAGGGLRGFGQLLRGTYGLNTTSLTVPQSINSAILASQAAKSLDEKTLDKMVELVKINRDMAFFLGEIAVNTGRLVNGGVNVPNTPSEFDSLERAKDYASRS